jgi:alpha-N-arabinofuranosidase
VILEQGKPIPYVVKGPRTLARGAQGDALAGNFTRREEFDGPLGPEWIQVHVPKKNWYELRQGTLQVQPLGVAFEDQQNTSFLARRQAHLNFDASTALTPPADEKVSAGLAAYQNDRHWYYLGSRRQGTNLQVFVERRVGRKLQVTREELLAVPASLKLRISAAGPSYSFFYDTGLGWQPLLENDDGRILSTEIAGGFVGTVLGPFARQE